MKIDIPAYPHGRLKGKKMDSLTAKSEIAEQGIDTSKRLFAIEGQEDGYYSIYKLLPVVSEGKTYISPFPNPVHLYLSLSHQHFVLSEKCRLENFPKCAEAFEHEMYLLKADDGTTTHACYTTYIQFRAASIIMLVAALEAFMNHIIDNNFIYTRESDGRSFDKEKIESPKISFNEKIDNVIPQYLNNLSFWESMPDELQNIKALYNHRKHLIHLKTESQDDFTRYMTQMEGMLIFEILNSIKCVIKFMNTAKPNFVNFKA